jgi:signal peptidase I
MDKTDFQETSNEEALAKEVKQEKSGTFLTVLLIVLSVLLLIVAYLNTQVFFLVQVEGESMLPTLKSGEVVVVNKKATLQSGDIVIIEGEKVNAYLIKRVIATEGQTVKIEGGKVFVDGVAIDEPYVIEENSTTVNGGVNMWELGENQVFFLGDNRPCSKDSRDNEYGPCFEEQVVGVVTNWSLKTMKLNGFVYKVGEFLEGK